MEKIAKGKKNIVPWTLIQTQKLFFSYDPPYSRGNYQEHFYHMTNKIFDYMIYSLFIALKMDFYLSD